MQRGRLKSAPLQYVVGRQGGLPDARFHPKLWESSGEGGRYGATMPGDERQHCDGSLAMLKECLYKGAMLLALYHSTVVDFCVTSHTNEISKRATECWQRCARSQLISKVSCEVHVHEIMGKFSLKQDNIRL